MTFAVAAEDGGSQLAAALAAVFQRLKLDLVFGHASMLQALSRQWKGSWYPHLRETAT